MLCYKDMTFCQYEECKKYKKCYRAMTEDVKKAAIDWWGDGEERICYFAEKPECFVEGE